MRLFETYKDLSKALKNNSFRFLPKYGPASFRCSQCKKEIPLNTGNDSIITGYAVTQTDDFICYACADQNQRADLITSRDGPIYAYVASNGKTVTTWTGGKLGDIVGYGESRAGWHGSTIAYFRVRDIHGQWWQGRGCGRGMACTLRPMKTPH